VERLLRRARLMASMSVGSLIYLKNNLIFHCLFSLSRLKQSCRLD